MHHFIYRGQDLYCEDVRIEDIVKEVGTPLYIYSHETLCRHFRAFDGAFSDMDHLTCFSVKSNSNIAILRLFANEGGGADIVSAGELFRCVKAGVPMKRIVYSGVGKSRKDMEYAIGHGILMFNVESEQELFNLNMVAEGMGKKVMISLRVNPDIDPKTHPYISTGLRENKFGIPIADAPDLYMKAYDLNNLIPIGVSCHIGSQLTELTPFLEALE
ncbi:MAG TPA: diaminopimelate decarboxylase, partial [Desulfobacteraceae bacterium]|nr:diaminopimelate decarboxylase [Desulfobacteraceae bacterium]